MAEQPYNARPPPISNTFALGPQDQVLAVLSSFQNADKHRQLITFAEGLDLRTVRIRDKATGQAIPTKIPPDSGVSIPKNGAVIHIGEAQAVVKATGAALSQ